MCSVSDFTSKRTNQKAEDAAQENDSVTRLGFLPRPGSVDALKNPLSLCSPFSLSVISGLSWFDSWRLPNGGHPSIQGRHRTWLTVVGHASWHQHASLADEKPCARVPGDPWGLAWLVSVKSLQTCWSLCFAPWRLHMPRCCRAVSTANQGRVWLPSSPQQPRCNLDDTGVFFFS